PVCPPLWSRRAPGGLDVAKVHADRQSISRFDGDTHMQILLRVGVRKWLEFAGRLLAFSLFAISSAAQQPVARITAVVDDTQRTTVSGTHPVMARIEDDAGRLPPGNQLHGVGIAFSRT